MTMLSAVFLHIHVVDGMFQKIYSVCACACLSEKRQAAEADKALISDTEMLQHRHVYTIAQASKCSRY